MRPALLSILILAAVALAFQPLNLCPNAVLVGPQNATAILNYIASAKRAVYLEVYELTWRSLAQELEQLAQNGVQVYVVLSGRVYGGVPTTEKQLVQEMEAAGVHVNFNYDFNYVHTKVYIVDNETLIIGSINPTYSGVTSDLGLALVIQNPAVASEAAEVVLNDYQGVYPSYSFQGFVISPINSYDALSWLLSQPGQAYAAVEEIYSDSGLAQQLMNKAALAIARVTDVSGVEQVQDLTAKVIAVGDYVYVGSINLSGNSINNNREMGLILYCPSLAEAAKALIEQWAGATPTAAASSSTSASPSATSSTTASSYSIWDILIAVVIIAALSLFARRTPQRQRRRRTGTHSLFIERLHAQRIKSDE